MLVTAGGDDGLDFNCFVRLLSIPRYAQGKEKKRKHGKKELSRDF
jgi:hypothetical protein